MLAVKILPADAGDLRDMGSLGQKEPLEEGMATHSKFLPGKSHGQRVRHDWSDWAPIKERNSLPRDANEDAALAGPPFLNFPSSLVTKPLISVRFPCLPCCQVSHGVDTPSLCGPDPPCQWLVQESACDPNVANEGTRANWEDAGKIILFPNMGKMGSLLLLGMVISGHDAWNCCSYLVTAWGWN